MCGYPALSFGQISRSFLMWASRAAMSLVNPCVSLALKRLISSRQGCQLFLVILVMFLLPGSRSRQGGLAAGSGSFMSCRLVPAKQPPGGATMPGIGQQPQHQEALTFLYFISAARTDPYDPEAHFFFTLSNICKVSGDPPAVTR